MAKKVAVTGYSGFIGKQLTEQLLKQGNIVYPIGRDFRKINCNVVYHLACPSTTSYIDNNPKQVMDIILDGTRAALEICPEALFINASSLGANDLDLTPQGAYNIAKRCMETYLKYSGVKYINYRLPAVYGKGMHDDFFIKRCVDGRAYTPKDPNRSYAIAHISEVIDAMITLRDIDAEYLTVGQIYEQFSNGTRTI